MFGFNHCCECNLSNSKTFVTKKIFKILWNKSSYSEINAIFESVLYYKCIIAKKDYICYKCKLFIETSVCNSAYRKVCGDVLQKFV